MPPQGLAGRRRRARGSGRAAGRDRRRFRRASGAAAARGSPRRALRAGLFHPTTGYSLPDAVRTGGRDRRRERSVGARRSTTCTYGMAQARLGASAASIACSTRCCSAPPSRESAIACSNAFIGSTPALIGRFYAGRSTHDGQGAHPDAASRRCRSAARWRRSREARDEDARIVIGAGFGGLALAIRLQSAGVATTMVEARDKPGGRAYVWEARRLHLRRRPDRHHRSRLPRRIVGAVRAATWRDDVELMPVMPFYRLNWPDGTNFDYSNDDARCAPRSRGSAPTTSPAIAASSTMRRASITRAMRSSAHVAFLDFGQMIKAAPALMRVSGVALGLFDRLELREEREAAPGAELPHAAGRRQSDDDQRDLRADPQAGEGRRRVVRQGRHQPAGRGRWSRCSSGSAGRAARRSGRPRSRRSATARPACRPQSGWRGEADAVATNADVMHTLSRPADGSRSAQRTVRGAANASASRPRCSSSISGSRAPGRASRTT